MVQLEDIVVINNGFFKGCVGTVEKIPTDKILNQTSIEVQTYWRKACYNDGWQGGYRPPIRDLYHVKVSNYDNMNDPVPKWMRKGQLVTFLQPQDITLKE